METLQRWLLATLPPLVLNAEEKPNTLRFLELVITIGADRLRCRLWNSVARNTRSGDTVLTRLLMMSGGTNRIGQLSQLGGAITHNSRNHNPPTLT